MFVCIPTAWVLTFKFNLGIAGLFYGMGTGQSLLSCLYIWIVYNIDWEKQVLVIKEQAEQEEKKLLLEDENHMNSDTDSDDEEKKGLISN